MIIIIIVVVVILVCILLGLGIFLWVRKKRKEDRETNSPVFCEDQPSEVGMRLSLLGKHYKITSILNLERKSSTTSTFRDKSSLTNSIEFNIPEVESEVGCVIYIYIKNSERNLHYFKFARTATYVE
jgi:hypothetical protein